MRYRPRARRIGRAQGRRAAPPISRFRYACRFSLGGRRKGRSRCELLTPRRRDELMHPRLVELLRCPVTGGKLTLADAVLRGERVESGWLVSESGGHRYVVRNFVPRFVPQSNYADNFGMQWNKFRRT